MEINQVFRRMNLDSDVRSLQPGEYRKLYNGIPISPQSSSYANAIHDIVSNVLGNALVSYSLPAGTNKVIGYLEDRAGNRGFYFVYNDTGAGASNSIYRIAGSTITLVLRTALLDFAATDFIHADIIGDVLTFTNQRTDIYKINVASAIAGGTYTSPAVLEEILLIKRPPNLVCTWALGYDALVNSNNLAGNYFSFYYRFIYEDKDYSVFSEFSTVTNSWVLPSIVAKLVSAETNHSLSGLAAIDGITPSGGDKVLVTANTSKIENGLYTAAAGAWSRVDLTAGDVPTNTFVYVSNGLKFFSTVWQYVDTGVVLIGTNDMYWKQIQGPNYITVTRNGAVPATVTKIEYGVRVNGSNEVFVYREERPAFSSSHTFYNDSYLFTVSDSESFKWNDSVPIKTKSLQIFENRLFLFNNTEGYTHNSTQQVTLAATSYGGSTETKAYTVRKAGGSYNVGLVFFDAYGRHSGVQMVKNITIQDSNVNRYNITCTTTAVTSPSWATHYTVAVTKCINVAYFLKDTTVDIYFYNKDVDGVYTYSKSAAASEGTLIDISSLTKSNRGYTYSAGDRIKIYNPVVSGYGDTIIDVEIQGQVGNYVIVRLLSELVIASTCTNLPFEIYTPKTVIQEPFYAVGERHAIADLAAGAHLLPGDVEIVKRVIYNDASYSATDPFANAYTATSLTALEAMNAWDKSFTNWVTQGGKSLVKTDSYELSKTVYIRYSNNYVQGANFLGINTFDALDEYALPVENGAGTLLVGSDVLVAVHEVETSSIYIGEGFVNTTDSNNFLAKTESVVGDDRKLQGGNGSVSKETIVERNGRVYYLDIRKGMVVRRSQDGLTVISDYGVRGEISTLCTAHIALGASSRIVGGWDPQYECYTLTFVDNTSTPTGYTYYFHEKTNAWVCLTDLRPEFWGILGQKQLGFLAGALYMQSTETNYNLFFTVQYNRRLEFEISAGSMVAIWNAVEIDVESIYTTAGTNEDILLLYLVNGGLLQTRINYGDFQLKEGVYRSAFFRSLNDVTMSSVTESKYKSQIVIRSQSAFLVLTSNSTLKNSMKSIKVFFTQSLASYP